MKKKILLLIMMLLMPLVSGAHDIAVQNSDGVTIYYNYISEGTELAVTYRGTFYDTYPNEYVGVVVIPEEVTYMNRTRKVTIISDYAFKECTGLTSVIIGNSVTSIGKEAFIQCSGLTSVTIPNSVTSIDVEAFRGCSSLSSITIPNSVTSIGGSAFSGCSGLKKVIVSDIAAWCSIIFGDYISNPLFYAKHLYSDKNTEIKDLIIPNSVSSIGEHAFAYCISLISITIPNSVTSIGKSAFASCSGLTSVTIPNSVTSIGNYAFHICSGLTSVTIPKSVKSIGIGAFDGVEIPTVISLIENPFAITGKTTYNRTFSLNTFNNATLYVPVGTTDKYKATEGWKDFMFIEEGNGGGETPPTPEKCENPTISYNNGKLTYHCETEGATCQYSITDSDIKSGSGDEVQLTATYNISVYATKAGYDNSDVATATLCWIDVEPKTEGITNSIANVPAKALLIQTTGGSINVQGCDDGERIGVYSINGSQVGTAVSQNGSATVNTTLQPGSVVIIKVGEKSIKVVAR